MKMDDIKESRTGNKRKGNKRGKIRDGTNTIAADQTRQTKSEVDKGSAQTRRTNTVPYGTKRQRSLKTQKKTGANGPSYSPRKRYQELRRRDGSWTQPPGKRNQLEIRQ
jgi:hypothetical protein